MNARVVLIGGRGYTGAEFLGLLARHPALDLVVATSGSRAGTPLVEVVEDWPDPKTTFERLEIASAGRVDADAWLLALPNGEARAWVAAIEKLRPDAVIVDFSADYRFDGDWVYGLTEWNRQALKGALRIANPGCYATGGQFGLLPLRDSLAAPPVVFGVSGHSGAGRAPSARNDPKRLRDNLIPYALTGHVHEAEMSTRLGRPVRFHPHVAPFFRGISLTFSVTLTEPAGADELRARFAERYAGEPLVRVAAEIPEIRGVAGSPRVHLGGFAVDARDPHRASFVVVLDNLLKGAASQAMQNLNLALGFVELAGIDGTDPE